MNPLGFNGTFEAFVAECKEDEKFYFDSAEALLQAYRTMCLTTSLHHSLSPHHLQYHYLIVITWLCRCPTVTTLQLPLAVTPSLSVIAAGVITLVLYYRRILTSFLNQHCKLCQKMLPVHLQHTTSPALQTGADPVGST